MSWREETFGPRGTTGNKTLGKEGVGPCPLGYSSLKLVWFGPVQIDWGGRPGVTGSLGHGCCKAWQFLGQKENGPNGPCG